MTKNTMRKGSYGLQSGQAARLGEEIERLNERHTEIVAQEEKKRKQLVEHYQVRNSHEFSMYKFRVFDNFPSHRRKH